LYNAGTFLTFDVIYHDKLGPKYVDPAGDTPMLSSRQLIICVLISSCLFGASTASMNAQTNNLATAENLSCVFPVMAKGTWDTNGPPSVIVEETSVSFQFEKINTHEATAEIIGPFGPAQIITRLTGDYLHFVQLFHSGPLYTTTVFDRQTPEGAFLSVHTRHEFTDVSLVGFTSRPEQYYGECSLR